MVVMRDTMRTPLASGENLTATGIVSPAANALCGSVKEYMTFPGQVFSVASGRGASQIGKTGFSRAGPAAHRFRGSG